MSKIPENIKKLSLVEIEEIQAASKEAIKKGATAWKQLLRDFRDKHGLTDREAIAIATGSYVEVK